MALVFNVKELMGTGYEKAYWLNCPVRYRVFYGARNTKKSWNLIGVEVIDKIMTSSLRNIVCFRRNYVDIKDSCFSSITSKLFKTGLFIKFKIKTSPFEITYRKTGQKILFKGCDRGTSINSNEVIIGELTDFYFEEAYELENYETFRQIDGSLRGAINDGTGVPKQVTLILNPWHKEGCWIYDIFVRGRLEYDSVALQIIESLGKLEWYDPSLIIEKGKGLYLMQTGYLINEFRDKEIYDKTAIEQKKRSLDIYLVEYAGFWGATGEVVYPEFSDKLIISRAKANSLIYKAFYLGLDTGFSNGEGHPFKGGTPSAVHTAYVMTLCGITADTNQFSPNNKDIGGDTIVAINEYYWSNELQTEKKTQPQLFEETINKLCEWLDLYQFNKSLMKGTIYVFVDCADAGSLTSLQEYARRRGLVFVKFMPSTKFKIHTRIMFSRLLMSWGEMLFSEACANLIREFKQCRKGEKGEERADINDHAINSYEYSTAPMYVITKKWANFKQK